MGMCPATTGILEYYMYYLRERKTSVTPFFKLFFNNGLVGEQERATSKQYF